MRPAGVALSPWHPAALIATGCGIGHLPGAPGTWASLAALPCGWLIRARWGIGGLAAAAGAGFVLGCWAAGRVGRASGVADAGSTVVDEIAGQWLTLLAAPLHPLAYAAAFGLFRLFDIVKPWPASWIDRRMKGGFGVMLDDAAAAGYAVLILLLARALIDV
ncbi:MAG TPA: phosphatidylglycerophosphatase A [Stellaceae bacterium]|nr:phosphatidylglycerophosphatase A [Stellaceae bacterium]